MKPLSSTELPRISDDDLHAKKIVSNNCNAITKYDIRLPEWLNDLIDINRL